MLTEGYLAQNARWPQAGRHIMAQYDDESIIVYQAYRPFYKKQSGTSLRA